MQARHFLNERHHKYRSLSDLLAELSIIASMISSFSNLSQHTFYWHSEAHLIHLAPTVSRGRAVQIEVTGAVSFSAKICTARSFGWFGQDKGSQSRESEFCSGRSLLAALFSQVFDAGALAGSWCFGTRLVTHKIFLTQKSQAHKPKPVVLEHFFLLCKCSLLLSHVHSKVGYCGKSAQFLKKTLQWKENWPTGIKKAALDTNRQLKAIKGEEESSTCADCTAQKSFFWYGNLLRRAEKICTCVRLQQAHDDLNGFSHVSD